MKATPLPLRALVTALRRHYGKPAPPISRDPFHLILWQQVGYLVPDGQRRRAFTTLRDEVGLDPAAIGAASKATLTKIARIGGTIAAAERAGRMRRSAEIVLEQWNGDLAPALRLPVLEARRAIAKFPMIGEPGADKILVFAKRTYLLPLDSNGLRVIGRLGLAPVAKDYRTAYRAAQRALANAIPRKHEWLIAAHALLRTHGQELCRRTAPHCGDCPLRARCPWAFRHGA
jgi:endonuclease III